MRGVQWYPEPSPHAQDSFLLADAAKLAGS